MDPEFLSDCRPSAERVGGLFDDLHDHAEGGAGSGHLHAAYDALAFVFGPSARPAPAHALPRQQTRGPLPDQGVRRLQPYDTREPVRRPRRRTLLRFCPEPWASVDADADADGARRTQLVLIGSGIDAAALGEELDACRRDADAPPADEHGMWGVLRYVPDGEDPDADDPGPRR
ncbi:GTP-binding protein OS=Streptomyces tendae OX=1932 GN=GUR47_34895 PE=3 SV=1 [Streptomyces tendae]